MLQIADLPKGEFVGYSATYRAAQNRKIAIVSIGYGDGIPRALSNIGKVFFKKKIKYLKHVLSVECQWIMLSAM